LYLQHSLSPTSQPWQSRAGRQHALEQELPAALAQAPAFFMPRGCKKLWPHASFQSVFFQRSRALQRIQSSSCCHASKPAQFQQVKSEARACLCALEIVRARASAVHVYEFTAVIGANKVDTNAAQSANT